VSVLKLWDLAGGVGSGQLQDGKVTGGHGAGRPGRSD